MVHIGAAPEIDVLGLQGTETTMAGEARWQARPLGAREVGRLESTARLLPHPVAEPILMLWGRGGVDPAVVSRRVRGFDLPQMLSRAAG